MARAAKNGKRSRDNPPFSGKKISLIAEDILEIMPTQFKVGLDLIECDSGFAAKAIHIHWHGQDRDDFIAIFFSSILQPDCFSVLLGYQSGVTYGP